MLSVSGCGPCAPPQASRAIEQVQPLIADPDPTAHKLVDSFDDGQDPNDIGGETVIDATSPDAMRAHYLPGSAAVPNGYALQLRAQVRGGHRVAWTTSLNELDISQAAAFTLWVKGARGGERFLLQFTDHDGGQVEVDASRVIRVTKTWQQAVVPAGWLSGVNLGHLNRLSVVVDQSKGREVTLAIDELAFHGAPELFFRSLADNLRVIPQMASVDTAPLLALSDPELLRRIAADTWKYFRELVDKRCHLVVDHVDLATPRSVGDFTSMTNLGLQLLAIVSAHDLGWLSRQDAVAEIARMLDQLEQLPRWHGLWYNYYMTTNLQIGRHYISSIDNGWFAAGLIIVRQAFASELAEQASRLLKEMRFDRLYTAKYGQFNLGFDVAEGYAPYHYGLLMTEARLLGWIGIGKGDIPRAHWWRLSRTLPPDVPQTQRPQGVVRHYDGQAVFQGYYLIDGRPVVPSWGGSLFEFLMPFLVVDEMRLSPRSFGQNLQRAVQIQIDHAARAGYPIWGISPCGTPDGSYGGYHEFGVPALGSQAAGGYLDEGVITPHASLLALSIAPDAVIKNVRTMLQAFSQLYGPYGLFDSVNVRTGRVSTRYLALDQGMILASLNNFLNDGILRKRFHADPVGQALVRELALEQFFEED